MGHKPRLIQAEKIMNKEEKDAVNEMEQIAELLGLEELANTTGGREIRRSEWDKLFSD